MIYIEVDKFREELVKHPEKSLPSLLVTINGLFSKLEASIGHFHTVCQSDSSIDGSYSFPLMFEKFPEVNQEGSQWVPVDLVIDHSIQVDVARSENAMQANMGLEFQINKQRFVFLKWGSNVFHNMLIVPPGSGIVHQVVIFYTNGILYPDSVVGTDSYTTMIAGLGVVGLGVGGIESEATMLGQCAKENAASASPKPTAVGDSSCNV
ncbi:unnamed protein product [Camellia sinensis]